MSVENNESVNNPLMEFTYKKNDNSLLFKSVVDIDGMNVKNPQNYIPLYQSFYSLTPKNYNDINLNNRNNLVEVKEKVTNNIFICQLYNATTPKTSEVFFKYSPILDPSKYLIGKYDIDDTDLLSLPSFVNTKSPIKVRDPNNTAYVDGFFSYLTSQLLHTHRFIHALDFYGSFLATKVDFDYNIIDDLEYLNDSDFFHKNNGTLFKIDNDIANSMFNYNTRRNKERLTYISNEDEVHVSILDDITCDTLEDIFIPNNLNESSEKPLELLYNYDITDSHKSNSNSNSECSSRSSVSDENVDRSSSEDDDEDKTSSDGFSTLSDEVMMATIPEFPVNVIALEKCVATLDTLISENGDKMVDEEWGSMIIQIIMTLLVYQKTYGFTHNDLHTNNVMYIETDTPFLYYKALGSKYKVPTFGRIFKIIDFGRAIYKFRGNIVCSDSYNVNGDAANLYNFEPYFNDKKPRLEPNFSFDLCRLGCSLLDFFIDDIGEHPDDPSYAAKHIIMDWCLDDKRRNVFYKTNGEERYPDFKLYKMIARTVHNSTPELQLKKKYFNKFHINEKDIDVKESIIDVDSMPSYI